MSAEHVHKIEGAFSGILALAVRARRLAANPANGVALPRIVRKLHNYPIVVQVPDLADAAATRPDDLVFTAPDGGVLRNRNARRAWFNAAAMATDLPGLTPHELRHTAASLAVSARASVLGVQRMLGHFKASVTLDVYADLFDTDAEAVAERLDAIYRRDVEQQTAFTRHLAEVHELEKVR